jgi:hypothetical protein
MLGEFCGNKYKYVASVNTRELESANLFDISANVTAQMFKMISDTELNLYCVG